MTGFTKGKWVKVEKLSGGIIVVALSVMSRTARTTHPLVSVKSDSQ